MTVTCLASDRYLLVTRSNTEFHDLRYFSNHIVILHLENLIGENGFHFCISQGRVWEIDKLNKSWILAVTSARFGSWSRVSKVDEYFWGLNIAEKEEPKEKLKCDARLGNRPWTFASSLHLRHLCFPSVIIFFKSKFSFTPKNTQRRMRWFLWVWQRGKEESWGWLYPSLCAFRNELRCAQRKQEEVQITWSYLQCRWPEYNHLPSFVLYLLLCSLWLSFTQWK